MACPCDSNVALKQTEKLTKYHLLKDEVHRMWQTKMSIVPVVVGALGSRVKLIYGEGFAW